MAMQEDDERIRGLVIRLARNEKMKSTDLPVVDDLMVSLKPDHLAIKRVFDVWVGRIR